MIPNIRKQYNESFTEIKYQQMLAELEKDYPNSIEFRIAETPLFLDIETKHRFLKAGDDICAFITSKDFQTKTANAIHSVNTPPNESPLPECIVMDFAISQDSEQKIIPKLIELQGFPSLFAFEVIHDQAFRKHFDIPNGYATYLNKYDSASYLAHLERIIKGTENKHTVLLELFPHQQKTKIDFYYTQHFFDIPIVCVSEIYTIGNKLFYKRNNHTYPIERIYNRVVWDELPKQSVAIQEKAKLLLQDLAIEWVCHPNHFYRISKYLMPFLKCDSVPSTKFLSALKAIPNDLENYVLKPLFSFAGQGVIIDITPSQINEIKDPENWILQEKVVYAPIVQTPTGNAKAEVRLFYFLNKATGKYIATCNLARISKGKMIGVSYNNTATWVGGSIVYFETN